MTIRVRKDENRRQLHQFLKRVGQVDSLHILTSPNLKCICTAFYEEKLAGMVMSWQNDFHPFCRYFDMIIDPNYNGLHIEEKLLSKVEEGNKYEFPLQTSIWKTAVSLKDIYDQNGFEIIRETYMPTLTVSKMEDVMMEERTIFTLGDILGNHLLMKKLTRIVKYTYEQMHLANPAAEIGVKKWEKMICADDTISDGSFVCLDTDGQEILAYAFLHDGESEDTLELGWFGAKGAQYKERILGLVERQITYAYNNHFSVIQGEFDTTDDYAMEVFKTFPFSPCTPWITYRKK